jgi:hypothetical protein
MRKLREERRHLQLSHAGSFITPLDNFDITRINTPSHHITISNTKYARSSRHTGVFANQSDRLQ